MSSTKPTKIFRRSIRCLAAVNRLVLSYNRFGSEAVAAALRINSSLRVLYLIDYQAVDRTHIDAVFIEALRLNPDRPAKSVWQLYSPARTSSG